MDKLFYSRIAKSNATIICRNRNRDLVLQHSEYLKDLIALAIDLKDKNHYKAVWIIEMLAESHPEILVAFLNEICEVAAKYRHESAIRGISRALLFLTISKKIILTQKQHEKIIEISLDRLIGAYKVAPKVYAMYALAHYAQSEEWIKEELKSTINKDFRHQSSGYKAGARAILQKINS